MSEKRYYEEQMEKYVNEHLIWRKKMSEKAIELLNEFVEREKKRSRIGSGDDRFYEEQIEKYVNEQKQFWIDYTKYLMGIKDKKKRRLKNE